MKNGPLELYNHYLNNKKVMYNQQQAEIIAILQGIYEKILDKNKGIVKIINIFNFKSKKVKGLYLWGGVGRGKTFLVDTFFDSIAIERKLRLHFHRFMQKVHSELKQLKGVSDPLDKIASKFHKEAEVICLDEFFVADITDAMLLAKLLEKLFKLGVVLVITSNIPPQELYKNGLQRSQFLPAIDLLCKNLQVVEMGGDIDYRLRTLNHIEIYHYPEDKNSLLKLAQSFNELAPEPGKKNQNIEILGRKIKALCLADDVIWFDFTELCVSPRSQNDYIEIAQCYHTVLISNVPKLNNKNEAAARRFIALVDEFYDCKVKLIISAHVDLAKLYQGQILKFEFIRTNSRLIEMQSQEYLGLAHKVCIRS